MKRNTTEQNREKAKKRENINSLDDYQTYVATKNGRMFVTFAERYTISAASDDSQKTACMRLLWVMLGEIGQEKKISPEYATTYPILHKQFCEFEKYNYHAEAFINLVENHYPCVLVGDTSGQAYKFFVGLENMQAKDADSIRKYCEKYRKKK